MENKTFAKGYCFSKIFIFFLIGCMIGTYYEELLWFFIHHTFSSRQGLIYGPFSPIYGIGVAIFVVFLGKRNDKRTVWKTLLYSSLIGGITEFMTSFIAKKFFDVEFWNYTGYFLNIMGRTTIPFMIGWGIGGTILMKIIYPYVSKWIEKIPYKYAQPIFIIVFIFILLDLVVTYSAFARMSLRSQNVKPYTFIGEFIDKTYDDEFMHKTFPVMKSEK